jgi:hypothetical protein
MGLDNGLGHGQAKAQAFFIHGGSISATPKTLENPLKLLRRNADAMIRDTHHNLVAALADLDLHLTIGLGIAHGIIKEDEEKLPKPRRVAAHQVVGAVIGKGDVHGPLVPDHLSVAAYLFEKLAQIDRL